VSFYESCFLAFHEGPFVQHHGDATSCPFFVGGVDSLGALLSAFNVSLVLHQDATPKIQNSLNCDSAPFWAMASETCALAGCGHNRTCGKQQSGHRRPGTLVRQGR
jgi:hypothetical protein